MRRLQMSHKVYVVNRGGHDYSPAEKYGELHFLSEGAKNILAVDTMYRDFSLTLRTSQPDDYILVTGPTIMCCVAISCFAFLHGRINMLIYKGSKYVARSIVLNNLLGKGTGPVTDQVEEMIREAT
jgi:hypothetical protein